MTWTLSNALLRNFENSHSSPGQVGESLAANSLVGAPSAPLNTNHTQGPSCVLGKTTAVLSRSRFGTMFGPLTEIHGEAVLTWFRAAFHAPTSAVPERERGLLERSPGCGERWQELWVKFDPVSCGWRTHQCLFPEALDWSCLTLPRWGMMQDGELLELPMPGRLIGVREFGLWPTPVKNPPQRQTTDGKNVSLTTGEVYGLSLAQAVRPSRSQDSGQATPQMSLNPAWVEWLMGWPIFWTTLDIPMKSSFDMWNEIYIRQENSAETHSGDEGMRSLQINQSASKAPHGWECLKQQIIQSASALQSMPCEGSSHDRNMGKGEGEAVQMSDLRHDIPAEKNKALSSLRQAGMSERDGQIVGRTAMGVTHRVHRLERIGNGQCPQAMALAWNILSRNLI